MADQTPEGLALPQQDAGAAFRAEMAVANFFMGYWRHLLAGVGVVLVGSLVYGQYTSWYKSKQMRITAEISDVRASLPDVLLSPYPSEEALTESQLQAAREGAAKLVAVGAAGSGTARTEAYLNAAELFRLAGDAAQQRAALEGALSSAKGALRFAAVSGLANLDLEEGKGEEAIQRWKGLAAEVDGQLAEQATLDLALAFEHLGRPEEARQVYVEFLAKWPASPRVEEASQRKSRIGGP